MRLVLCAIALLVPAVATAEVAADRAPGTRPYLVDATIGFRSGETTGWNARLFAGGVPWGNLVPSRRDRSVYLALGGQAGIGQLHLARWRTTWSVGPELRSGVAWGGGSTLEAHAYLAISPMLVHLEHDPMLAAGGSQAGVRVAMGLSGPGAWRAKRRVAGDIFAGDDDDADFGSASGAMGDRILMVQAFLVAFLFVLPDTIEVTYERTRDSEWTGLALGYSL